MGWNLEIYHGIGPVDTTARGVRGLAFGIFVVRIVLGEFSMAVPNAVLIIENLLLGGSAQQRGQLEQIRYITLETDIKTIYLNCRYIGLAGLSRQRSTHV